MIRKLAMTAAVLAASATSAQAEMPEQINFGALSQRLLIAPNVDIDLDLGHRGEGAPDMGAVR